MMRMTNMMMYTIVRMKVIDFTVKRGKNILQSEGDL